MLSRLRVVYAECRNKVHYAESCRNPTEFLEKNRSSVVVMEQRGETAERIN